MQPLIKMNYPNLNDIKSALADKYIGTCDACHKRFEDNEERIDFGGTICRKCYNEVGDLEQANKQN